MRTIAVLGTFDTKGAEHAFVADRIRELGYEVLIIDVSTSHPSPFAPSVAQDRGTAIAAMIERIPAYLRKLFDEQSIDGVISMGGSGGTAIATAAMRGLPLGFPKVMVSTMAGKEVSAYVDISDIVMIPSIVDVSGLNRISKAVFARGAAVVVALAETNAKLAAHADLSSSKTGRDELDTDDRPLIAASMFGNTTRCIEQAKPLLEAAGYEVLVFHATGIGGRTMEAIIESGAVSGVLDITTTEWADELVGGVMGGGPTRLEASARLGIPAIIAPGCLDMVNFGPRESVPDKFRDRLFYQHNPQVTLMRTTPDECRELGRIIAGKLNRSTGPVAVVFPLRGLSVISGPGQPFCDPVADQALMTSFREHLRKDIRLEAIDGEINDPIFAETCVRRLLEFLSLPQAEHP